MDLPDDSVPAGSLAPAMTQAEQALLHAAVHDRPRMLEFGCGGSTVALVEAGIGHLLSVDSDPAWLGRVGRVPACAAAMAEGRLLLRHADIGPVGAWGRPSSPFVQPQWARYWRDPWDLMREPPDIVLVDGRFRVACALAGIPRLAGGGGLLLLHDFWHRQCYRAPVLRHYAVEGSAGSLVLLRPRMPVDAAQLAVDLAAHAFDPD